MLKQMEQGFKNITFFITWNKIVLLAIAGLLALFIGMASPAKEVPEIGVGPATCQGVDEFICVFEALKDKCDSSSSSTECARFMSSYIDQSNPKLRLWILQIAIQELQRQNSQ